MARSCRNGVGGRTAPAGRLPSPWTAWLTIVVIPATLVLLQVVHRCWVNLDLREHAAPLAVIPVGRWDRNSQETLARAVRLPPGATAPHRP